MTDMKVMLLKDVYKLGRAGEVKRVAAGYGRNYLIPQGMATLATEGALKQSDRIKQAAAEERARLNQELEAVHERLNGLQLNFPMRAGETGKLYGSVTTQMISDAIREETGVEVERHQIDSESIKTLGVHSVPVRLTVDLIPELTAVVHEEDLPPESAFEVEEAEVEVEAEAVGVFSDLQAELEAEEAELEAAEAELEGEQEAAEEQLETEQVEQMAAELRALDAGEPEGAELDQAAEPESAAAGEEPDESEDQADTD